ncbi:MAG: cobalamin-dependent protein [Saprospiraceae bacterium]|nr:cobalamin-dependent protein [Saprospiraceae bacterium]
MKKVLLINPAESTPGWPTTPRAVEPMGLLYVAGAFQEIGVETTLLDLQLGFGDQEEIYRGIARSEYSAAGIALASQACVWDALKIAQDLKNLNPDLPIFSGGVFASLNPEWVLDTTPAIDFVVIGEGEPFVTEFVLDPGNWKQIPNVRYRGQLLHQGNLPATTLSRPHIRPDRSLTFEVIKRGEAPSVVATRGCGGGCTFCCISHYYGSSWQSREVGEVHQEIEDLVRNFGVRRIHLVDDNLFGHSRGAKEWVRSFITAMKNFDPPLRFKTTCRLDDLDEHLIPDIKRAGFDLLKIGIETFSRKTQKVYHKGMLRYKAEAKLDALLKTGINVSLGFIMFDPYCSLRDIEENLEFLLNYPDCWGRHLLRSKLVAYQNTPIIASLQKDGLALESGILGVSWRFQDQKVADFHRRFEAMLRGRILPLEWEYFHHQRSLLRQGFDPPRSAEIDALFKNCWIDIFTGTLKHQRPSSSLENRLLDLTSLVEEYGQSTPSIPIAEN